MFALCALLVELHLFRTILVQLLPVGHTHDIVDAWFGEISKTLEKERFIEGVLSPAEWIDFLKSRCAADHVQPVWTIGEATRTFTATSSSSASLEGFKHGARVFFFELSSNICSEERKCVCGGCVIRFNTEASDFGAGMRRSLVTIKHRPWMQDSTNAMDFRHGGASFEVPMFPMPFVFNAVMPNVTIASCVVTAVGAKLVKLFNGLLRGGALSFEPVCEARALLRVSDLTAVEPVVGNEYRGILLTKLKIQSVASAAEDENACSMATLLSRAANIRILRRNVDNLGLAAEASERAAQTLRSLSQEERGAIQTSATKAFERKRKGKAAEPAKKMPRSAAPPKPKKQRQRKVAQDDSHDDICNACRKGGYLYLCAYCPHAYHLPCLSTLESADLDSDSWRCPGCEVAGSENST